MNIFNCKKAFCKALSKAFTSLFVKICGAFKKKQPVKKTFYGVTVTYKDTGESTDYIFSTYEERWSFCKDLSKRWDVKEYDQIIRR
ncbi:MAG: hypothetical protein M0R51_15145 [Clostridia bacterium]|jgi:hypothetical protein|nr:hypothetical protein [Clostridia bacterium]